ncbi:MAG: ExbD/TolR family protein [Gammaproteobacteria bacterium]|uniref:ExbD/TolR family protein n=1 Tax=Nevskia sp. TaxID=1929292 RepID=UPI0040372F1A|nr:ExbD/TolR family protein [Gammaproteobacteria bacterium]
MAKKKNYEEAALAPVAEINITPMVDVMLVLLIIFMVTSPLMMSQLPVTLPKASSTPSENPKEPTVVEIDAGGNYYITADQLPRFQVTPEQLQPELLKLSAIDPDQLVFVQGDAKIDYGRVVDLIGLVSASGFSKVSLKSAKLSGGGVEGGIVPVP